MSQLSDKNIKHVVTMNTAGIEVNSPSKHPAVSCVQKLKHSGPSRKTSSGVTLKNVETQTRTVVTGFAVFMPVIPPPSAPSQTNHETMSVWYYDTYKCDTLFTQSEVFTSWHWRKKKSREIHPLGVLNNALHVLVPILQLLRHSVSAHWRHHLCSHVWLMSSTESSQCWHRPPVVHRVLLPDSVHSYKE